jgi:hypothetical protein
MASSTHDFCAQPGASQRILESARQGDRHQSRTVQGVGYRRSHRSNLDASTTKRITAKSSISAATKTTAVLML